MGYNCRRNDMKITITLLLLSSLAAHSSQIASNLNNNILTYNHVKESKDFFKLHQRNYGQMLKILLAQEYRTAEWIELLPEDDLEALLNPPEYLDEIEENSDEDQISNRLRKDSTDFKQDRYQEALNSSRIVPSMDGVAIRIPGFIVPLEFDDEQNLTQFFLVPWFGACIHLPPPPPNQIILVNSDQGISNESLYTPFWISGILNTSLIENDLATAAYVMEMHAIEVYTED